MTSQCMEDFQLGALTATARDGSNPNEDPRGVHWSLWSSNCGEVSQWSTAHKKGTHDLETTEGGVSQDCQDTDTERG